MPRQVTDLDLEKARRQGTVIQRPAERTVPDLTAVMEQMLALKKEQSDKYDEKCKAKLAKMDELIASIQNLQTADNSEVMKMLATIQKEHGELVAAMAEQPEKDWEPCTYKVTGRRDQRGLIDLEYGLTFSPVE